MMRRAFMNYYGDTFLVTESRLNFWCIQRCLNAIDPSPDFLEMESILTLWGDME